MKQNFRNKGLFFNFPGTLVVTVRTVFAVAFATIASFQMIGFGENDKTFFTQVIIIFR